MKHPYFLLLLSLAAANAAAFQPKGDRQLAPVAGDTARSAPDFLSFHLTQANGIHPGSCAATAVSGCGCPFCTQLRNAAQRALN